MAWPLWSFLGLLSYRTFDAEVSEAPQPGRSGGSSTQPRLSPSLDLGGIGGFSLSSLAGLRQRPSPCVHLV